MKKRIFVSALSFRIPGFSQIKDLNNLLQDTELPFSFQAFELNPDKKVKIYHLQFDPLVPFHPSRKDLKVMRDDVIASTICAQEILEMARLGPESRAELPLFMSNGVCMDQLMDNINDISSAYISTELDQGMGSRHQRVEKATPPLFVLNALTNASESFVSQYTGVKGDNTVYGNTSHSTFYCLEEAIKSLEEGNSQIALVGASSGAGLFSALTFKNQADLGLGDWKLSNAGGFILLESEESLRQRGYEPLAEILMIMQDKKIPSLFDTSDDIYKDFTPHSPLAYFSGGLGEGDYQLEKKKVKARWTEARSFYPSLGCLGVFAPLMNLVGAIHTFQSQNIEAIDCLSRDPYGRESFIQLKKVEGRYS